MHPKDMIAIVALSLFTYLKISGVDGEASIAIAVIIGYYFGHRTTKIDNGK